MSDEKEKEKEKEGQEKEQYVPASAYESLKEHSSKSEKEAKEAKARLAQLEADLKARDTREMEEKQEFQKLYEQERAEKEALSERLDKNDRLYKDSIRKSHLKEALGGQVKDQYLDFADVSSIELDSYGRPTEESIKKVAEKFREEHSQLIPKAQSSDPNSAPPGQGPGSPGGPSVEEITSNRDSFHQHMRKLLKQQ